MLLAAIFGSPRKGGNTDQMAEAFLEGAAGEAGAGLRVERIYSRELRISGCLGCGYCDDEGVCIQKDDMGGVISLLDAADRVVLASPIYFYGVPGQLKLLIDRSQAPFMRKQLRAGQGQEVQNSPRARKGFLLSAGATRGKRVFDCAVLTSRYFFDALDIAYAGELCFREIDAKGDIRRHLTALDDCRRAGKEFVAADRS